MPDGSTTLKSLLDLIQVGTGRRYFSTKTYVVGTQKNLLNERVLKVSSNRLTVGNMSGYRCESDCKSRGHEFDPGPVQYFRGDFLRSFTSLPLNHSSRVVVSYSLQAKVCA